jgi:dTDP-4-dehydrorhamnose 3,5-epimerase
VRVRPLAIAGAYEVAPVLHGDARGLFLEYYRYDRLAEAVGHPLRLAQGNLSVSARGVVRGLHFAAVPPGQAKYVQCVRGAVLDVVVDLRVGSPTFGRWESVRLDDVERRALYIAEGLGHGICALTDGATLEYLCSETYAPDREHAVHPLDGDLGVDWQVAEPLLSPRDAAAPSLAEARDRGLLPDHAACLAHYASLGAPPRGPRREGGA